MNYLIHDSIEHTLIRGIMIATKSQILDTLKVLIKIRSKRISQSSAFSPPTQKDIAGLQIYYSILKKYS